MKNLLLTLVLSLSVLTSFSQTMNEKRALKEKHIDFSKEYLYFELTGLIELNGIIFNNDTCDCPIIYKATINNTELVNKCTNEKYDFLKFITFGKKKIISIDNSTEIKLDFRQSDPQWFFVPDQGITTPTNNHKL
jgi:hypothetical protein